MTSLSKAPYSARGFVIGFLSLHGLLFIGGGYIASYSSPWFALMHSGIGIFVYLVFLAVIFQKHFISALTGALITMLIGWFLGDFFLSHFYPASVERTLGHQLYASMVLFYLYLFFDLVIFMLRKKS